MAFPTRLLGLNGPRVSALGLGCMSMSGAYGLVDAASEAEAVATIRAALDAGVTFFNTGDFYGQGHNEMLLGEALRGRREEAFISVKFGGMRDPDGAFIGFDTRPVAVRNFAAYSLRRLKTEVMDLYQPARTTPDVPLEDTVGAVAELIQKGHVRWLGLSEVNADQLRRAHKVHPVTAVEVEYGLATRVIERELLATCRELGVGVVAYGVMSRGLLSSHVSKQHIEQMAHWNPRFTGDHLAHNLQQVERLSALAQARGCTTAQLAIAWVLHRGDDIVPLIGTGKRSRLAENLAALEVKLSAAELAELDAAFPEGAFSGDRYPEAMMHFVVK